MPTTTTLTDTDIRNVYTAAMSFFATDRNLLNTMGTAGQQFDQWLAEHDRQVINQFIARMNAANNDKPAA